MLRDMFFLFVQTMNIDQQEGRLVPFFKIRYHQKSENA